MDPVLIVDDEKDNLEALQRLLRNQFKVTITQSPFEALKIVQREPFNVIVSDQRMPEMSGVELLEKIKNVSPSTIRILLTGYTDIDSVIGAINRGNIYRYIAKPWDPEDFKLTLRQANEAFQLRRELEQKNEALEKSNRELQKALSDLRLLDRAKARFLSLISHELNTPLTVLTSFVSLLEENRDELSAEMQKAVTKLGVSSQRFSEIVNEVLTYTRLESENELVLVPFEVKKELTKLKKELEKSFASKKVQLEILGTDVVLKCDAEKMKVALAKLLHDAFTRSPAKARVKVTASAEGTDAKIAVWREGETLSQDAFQPLEATKDEMHHHRNLGLSLAICRLIVEGHGGEVTLQSSTSKGTTVTLCIPT